MCRSLVDLVVSVSPSLSSLSACWGGWKEEEFPAHFLCELVCDHLRSDTLTSWSRLSSAPATSSSSRLCRTRKTKRINPKTHRTIPHPVARSRRQLWSALPNWNSFGPLCARVPTMQKVVAVVNPPQHFGKSRSLIAYLQIHLGKRTTTYFLAFKNENRLQGGSDAEPVSANEAIKDSLLLLFFVFISRSFISQSFFFVVWRFSQFPRFLLLDRASRKLFYDREPAIFIICIL